MNDYDYDTFDYDDEHTDYTDSDDYNDCDSDYDNSEYADDLDCIDGFELWEPDYIEFDCIEEVLDPSDDYNDTGAWEINDTENEVDDDTAENLSEDTAKETDENTDWSRTSLSPEEEALLNEMEENGKIEFLEENPDLVDPEHTALHLPTEKTGDFAGEKGNSEFRPLSEETLRLMNKYDMDFVDYKDNYPDFSPFTEHDSEWGKINGQVEIGHMTDNRENASWEYGRRPNGVSHDPDYDIGNFAQADNAIAEQLRDTYPDIKSEDIEAYRTANHLTWHECADGKTMQLIPREIHDACRHSGGVSEMNYRMAWGDVTRKD